MLSKKLNLMIILILILVSNASFAAGGITHMFIATEVVDHIKHKKFHDLLLSYNDAYLVGSNYPDSGYVDTTHYGEDSHWEPFIQNFVSYLKEKYSHPIDENPQLVAFLMGCATHRISDPIFHEILIPKIAIEDFSGDRAKAHTYADRGLDLIILIDKNQWTNRPKTWWVPIEDLINIYHRMGKNDYTPGEIILGNKIMELAGIGERGIAYETYPFLKLKMPWTVTHYYSAAKGDLLEIEEVVTNYLMKLWNELEG